MRKIRVRADQIPVDDQILVADAKSQAYNLHAAMNGDDRVFQMLLDVIDYMARGRESIHVRELVTLCENYAQALEEGDYRFLQQPRGMRVDRVVDVVEFVESKQFLGQRGYVRPVVLQELWNIFHSEEASHYLEIVLGGSIGWGKSYLSEMGIGYMLYMLSCFHCPQIEFGLAPGSSILFIMQSIKLELAKKVLFQQFGARVRESPYFRQFFPYDKDLASEMKFPNGISIIPLSSSDTAALGLNVFGGILDELNFMAVIENSVRSMNNEGYDQAEKLYTTIVRRMKSRFNVQGKVPGKLFLVSSANYPGDFVERKIDEARVIREEGRIPHIYSTGYSQWDAIQDGRWSEQKFLVEVGDASRQSRILKDMAESVEPESVIEVPMDFYDDFRRDIEAAIRDLAGIPVGAAGAFIRQREKIELAASMFAGLHEGRQLFLRERVELGQFAHDLPSLIDTEFLDNLGHGGEEYAAHVDLGLTQDSCGIALARLAGYTRVGASLNWSETEKKYVQADPAYYPLVSVDGVLEIIAPMNDEIDIATVGDLLCALAARLNLVWVTADQFQSAALMQRMRKTRNKYGRKIGAFLQSVDATLAPYAEVKQALRDERLMYPNIEKLKRELRELQLDHKRGKVDHPPTGSKDISDAVAGSAFTIFNTKPAKKQMKAGEVEKEGDRPAGRRRRRLH